MKVISVCVPCFNEAGNIKRAYQEITKVMKALDNYDYEILFEDNASTDGSQEMLRELALCDAHVRVIFNQKNFGPGRSGTNCLIRSRGDAAILIPCDMQDPPGLIPQMISAWERGSQVVWGQKTQSEENGLMFNVRRLYYYILIELAEVDFYPQVDGFGLYDRAVLEDARKYCDSSIGVKGLVGRAGYSVELLPYHQNERKVGTSSYSVFRYLRLALQTVTSNSTKPLDWMVTLSCAVALFGVIFAAAYVIVSIVSGSGLSFADIGIILLILIAALQFLAISLVGRYVGRIREQLDKEPLVFEKEEVSQRAME